MSSRQLAPSPTSPLVPSTGHWFRSDAVPNNVDPSVDHYAQELCVRDRGISVVEAVTSFGELSSSCLMDFISPKQLVSVLCESVLATREVRLHGVKATIGTEP